MDVTGKYDFIVDLSALYSARTEHVGCSPTRKTSLALRAERRGVLSGSREGCGVS